MNQSKTTNMIKPSKHQLALFDAIKNGTSNILVQAVAGSGKSTSLVESMKLIPVRKTVRFFAFGKDIVEDLKTKVPNSVNISVSTIHSYGMKQCMKCLENKPEIDDRKYIKIMEDMYIDMKDGSDSLGEAKKRVLPIVHYARVNMLQTWEDALAMSSKYDVVCTEDDAKLAMAIIRRGMKEVSSIDMTDMIWLPVALKMKVEKFDIVMIDECQDLSELQRSLVLSSMNKGGRFVAVGDPAQAIFGFAGADVDSFNKFKLIPNTIELPLSVCYRCPKEVIDLAKTLVPSIEPTEKEAASTSKSVYNSCKVADIKAGDLILARNTYPLVKLGFQYIAAGVTARILGRDIGKNLVTMIKNTKADNFDDMHSMFKIGLEKIESDLIRLRGMTRDEAINTDMYTSYQDKVEAIRCVGEGCKDIQELTNKILSMFSDESGDGITLSTIHKAKGLGYDNVYIIHSEMMPSKNAKTDWARTQEYNLMYVAYTRAKKKLGFVSDFNAWGKSSVVIEKKPEQKGEARGVKYDVGSLVEGDMTIIAIKEMKTSFGTTNKYVMNDMSGRTIVKLGSMAMCKIVSGNGLKVGSTVKIKAPVKGISTFNGVEEINLGMLVSVN